MHFKCYSFHTWKMEIPFIFSLRVGSSPRHELRIFPKWFLRREMFFLKISTPNYKSLFTRIEQFGLNLVLIKCSPRSKQNKTSDTSKGTRKRMFVWFRLTLLLAHITCHPESLESGPLTPTSHSQFTMQ